MPKRIKDLVGQATFDFSVSAPSVAYELRSKYLQGLIDNGCHRCRRCGKRSNIMFGDGSNSAEVMFVAEWPDKDSEGTGAPFSGSTDAVFFNRLINAVGLKRRDVYATYLVKCGSDAADQTSIRTCGKYLHREIDIVHPKLVVLMGKACLKYIKGEMSKLDLMHGAPFKADSHPGVTFLPIRPFSRIFSEPSIDKQLIEEVKRALSVIRGESVKRTPVDYYKINTIKDLKTVLSLADKHDEISFDIETDGAELFWESKIACWAIAWQPGKAAYFPVSTCSWAKGFAEVTPKWSSADLNECLNLWSEFFKHKLIMLHNGKYDLKILKKQFGIDLTYYWDTKVSAKVIDNTYDTFLKQQAWAYTDMGGYEEPLERFKQISGTEFNYSLIPDDIISDYVCGDADCTLRLKLAHDIILKERGQEFVHHCVNMPISRIFRDVEYEGVLVDKAYLEKQDVAYDAALTKLSDHIQQLAGMPFNVSSAEQLAYVLFKHLRLPVISMGTSHESTDGDSLEKLKGKHPIIEPLLEYRAKAILHKNFIKGILSRLDERNHVHTEYKIGSTDTGRTASAHPNLQNLPRDNKDIKTAFIAEPGYILAEADFSQVEVRVLADVSQDPQLIADLNSGMDIHRKMASSVYNIPFEQVTDVQRSHSKSAVFGIIYGMHYKTLAEEKGMTVEDAEVVYNNFYRTYHVAKEWMDSVKLFVREHGYVRSPFGRIRYLEYINHPNEGLRMQAERCAVNTPIQATGADIPNLAIIKMVETYPQGPDTYNLFMQVHDAAYLRIKASYAAEFLKGAKPLMETATPLSVPTPVEVKIGHDLGHMFKISNFDWCGI